jgi:acyl carrier protein
MLDVQLVEVISRVLDIPEQQVTPDLSFDTIAAWDSVNHLKLILGLEEAFRLRFSTAEIPNLVSVGRIQEALSRLVKQRAPARPTTAG